jgi:hypothetical protein
MAIDVSTVDQKMAEHAAGDIQLAVAEPQSVILANFTHMAFDVSSVLLSTALTT